jgi:hypothetical protein
VAPELIGLAAQIAADAAVTPTVVAYGGELYVAANRGAHFLNTHPFTRDRAIDGIQAYADANGKPGDRAEAAAGAILIGSAMDAPGAMLIRPRVDGAGGSQLQYGQRGVLLYEVGLAKDLRANPFHGLATGTVAEHSPQTKWARDLVVGHRDVNDQGWEPTIRVTRTEADAITPAETLTEVPAGARDALALKIRMLRNLTDAPNLSLKQLIQLNRDMHFWDYRPLHRIMP